MTVEFEPILIKIEREDDDWLVDEPGTSHYVEAKIEREENRFKCNHPNCKYSTNILRYLKNHKLIHSDERSHKCDKCERSFRFKCYLRTHRKKVHFKEVVVKRKKPKVEIFTCKELNCKFSTHYKRSLETHKVIHSKERPFKCVKCERAFKISRELKNHLQYHSEESPYQCDKCDKSFKRRIHLKMHMMLHSTETPFQCDKCDRSFKVKRSLAYHKLIHEPKDDWYKCDLCDYTTSQRFNFKHHKFKHIDAKPIKCDSCERSFKHEAGLRNHKNNVHLDGKKPFKCDKCDYRSRCSRSLKEHLLKHMEPNTLKFENCDYPNCKFSTPVQRKLKVHKRRVHESLKLFKCHQCERAFIDLGSLKRHSFSHAKIKPIKCERCRYSCAYKNILRKHHSSKHINEKEHKCEECGDSYDTEKDLTIHKLRHDEANRKFKCNLCPFRSFANINLLSHVRLLHNNKKSFKCETCYRSFNLRCNLKAHQFLHSKTKNFKCHLCDYRTHCQRNLKCHLLISHPVSNEKSWKICDECGLLLRDELDSRTHQDAHRPCFVPLRNIIVRHVKIELEDFVKKEIV